MGMTDLLSELPGLESIRARFVSLLEDRQIHIAEHALAAWDSENSEQQANHLKEAQNVLHQISGTAGSLGFDTLGHAARACEGSIISYLEVADPEKATLPHALLAEIDAFVALSQSLLSKSS